MKKTFIVFLLFFLVSQYSFSQQAIIYGKITDTEKEPIPAYIIQDKTVAMANSKGLYEIKVKSDSTITILIKIMGYKTHKIRRQFQSGKRYEINVMLESAELDTVVINEDKYRRHEGVMSINFKDIDLIPDASGGDIVAALRAMPGVAANNELSTQYSVRGGNFDENLVYVNDIEVYRPTLMRSGQQEGLSFANPNMVSSIVFSSGGFDAKYGDKMSSVLDIKYKRPTKFGGSVSTGLLGVSTHIEGRSKDARFTHISGFRYKTSQYLLNTLETSGEYKPDFKDFQTFMTYNLTGKLELSFLGNYSQNNYHFVPIDRNTAFGTVQQAYNLFIDFEGQELDKFVTYTGALAIDYHPTSRFRMKFIASAYHTAESETFDIQGRYSLNQLDKDLGSSSYGDSILNLGIGRLIDHARNYLTADVMNFSYKNYLEQDNHFLQWGVKYQHEIINREINEWELLDSAGYSIPYTGNEVNMTEFIYADNFLESNRYSGYFQDTYSFDMDSAECFFTAGVRSQYWDFNKQFLISPRLKFSWKPNWKRDFLFRISSGIYYQSPFFKEMQDRYGKINYNIKAQRSIHFVLSSDYNFIAWNRPFKFITELYYKKLDNLIPYEIDNMRIRYMAFQQSKGYATGLDFKVNGEFVEDVDSWISFSLLKSYENVLDDGIGYVPRPTNQLANVGLFFQDYVPRYPSFKMQLSLLYGTALPHWIPNSDTKENYGEIPPYKRVDIGISKILKNNQYGNNIAAFKHFDRLIISLEVFNMLAVSNTVSYFWVTVVPNTAILDDAGYNKYAIPNRLTDRRFNLKLTAKF